MTKDLEELLKTTTEDFKIAEQQYLEFDGASNPSTLKIRKANYDNAANILNLVEQMAGKKTLTPKKERDDQDIKVHQVTDRPKLAEPKKGIVLNFPDYDEIQEAKPNDRPEIKISTSDVLREAAKKPLTLEAEKTEKDEKTSQNSATTMTREQYRKLHNKK